MLDTVSRQQGLALEVFMLASEVRIPAFENLENSDEYSFEYSGSESCRARVLKIAHKFGKNEFSNNLVEC